MARRILSNLTNTRTPATSKMSFRFIRRFTKMKMGGLRTKSSTKKKKVINFKHQEVSDKIKLL